jgi:plastocyanin domain-containing protein
VDFLKFRRARFTCEDNEAEVFWLCFIELVVTYLPIKEILEVDFEIDKLLYLKNVSENLTGSLEFVLKHCFQTHRSCQFGMLVHDH